MTIDAIVTDPALRSFLQTSQHAREQALGLADRLAELEHHDHHGGGGGNHGAPPLTADQRVELSKEQKLLNTNLSHLRGLHRAACLGARDTKAQTAEARQEVDVLHLQLQNLYYEQRHLQGEIAACESFEYVVPSPIHPLIFSQAMSLGEREGEEHWKRNMKTSCDCDG
jgi:THO complex subunit 5